MRHPATGLAIEASGLVKTFGATRALDGIDLTVPAGTVYGPKAARPGCSATTWSATPTPSGARSA